MKLSGVIFTALTLIFCTVLCGCAEKSSVPSEISAAGSASESDAQAPEISAESEFLLNIDLTHPDSADSRMIYMLFVKKDGTVLTTQYCNDKGYDFFRKKSQCDPDIFNQADPLTELGRLTEEECSKLTEAVTGTDINAEKYMRSSDGTPEPTADVEETYHLAFHLYVPGGTALYTAYSHGEQKGDSIRSEDPNAMAAVRIIQDTALYQQWLQNYL